MISINLRLKQNYDKSLGRREILGSPAPPSPKAVKARSPVVSLLTARFYIQYTLSFLRGLVVSLLTVFRFILGYLVQDLIAGKAMIP